jgi:hypothetical protein
MGDIMSPQIASSNNLNSNYENADKFKTDIGIVYDVILDETGESKDIQTIGAVKFRFNNDTITPSNSLQYALPYDKNCATLPVRNEQVHIIKNGLGYYYQRIQPDETPNNSAFINQISFKFENTKNSNPLDNNSIEKYRKIGVHKTPVSNKSVSNDFNKFGNYFTLTNGIHKIKLYEGDTTIQSRFGQSLRFSAYNNPSRAFSPTLIIRNKEASENNKKERGVSVEEDVNRDGSIIAMTSGQHQSGFIPGTVDDKGKSDFKRQPDSFGDLPKLIGDQMLLSSGRIILSSKNAETLIYSKKNIGFVSDGAMSIDTKLGMDISVGDDINIVTADRDVNIVSGKGNIFLGSEDLEAMVKGKKLVELLNELLQAILDQQYLTPSGPSAIGPVNKATFASIQSKLDGVLSKLNQTA